MARHIAGMWMPKTESVGVLGPVSDQGDSKTVEVLGTSIGRRSWIPPTDSMPPIVQFVLSAVRWLQAKCVPSAKPGTPLRLVAQLSLGAKRHVSVVEVNGVQFLVGGGTENVTVIVPITTKTAMRAADVCNAARELQS